MMPIARSSSRPCGRPVPLKIGANLAVQIVPALGAPSAFGEIRITHSTLPGSHAGHASNRQKTAILGARLLARSAQKAGRDADCVCSRNLESAYISNLASRGLCPRLRRGSR